MDNKLAGVLILTAFVGGYGLCLYQAPLELPAVTVINSTHQSSSSSDDFELADIEYPEENSSSSAPATSQASSQKSAASANSLPNPDASQTATQSQASSTIAAPANTASNQLSDEEIDQLIPKPFNSSFKKAHPDLKTKYKDFVDPAKGTDDWDLRMQGLLRDFVMSRPMAADIVIESLQCRANMCEMRLLENKKFLLLGLFSELMQQPWMANQVNGSVDFNPENSNAFYMLLMRKPTP